jgi:hypothetical protein
VNGYEDWFEAHLLFVYETFLYVVAALIKTESFGTIHLILTNHYLRPSNEWYGDDRFDTFYAFFCSSNVLQILAPEGQRLLAPAAELVKRQADRTDLPFQAVMQADLLVLMMAFINDGTRWNPQTILYFPRSSALPFFLRATQHRNFQKLAKITGFDNADKLREAVKAGQTRLRVDQWHEFIRSGKSFWEIMNMDALDTLK